MRLRRALIGLFGVTLLGMAGFAGLIWFTVFDRGLGWRRWYLGLPAATFATVWFVPGVVASAWTLCVNLGIGNLRRIRTWPLLLVFAMTGLIGFRAVFTDLARRRIRPRRVDQIGVRSRGDRLLEQPTSLLGMQLTRLQLAEVSVGHPRCEPTQQLESTHLAGDE